jgi:hypothetical protein
VVLSVFVRRIVARITPRLAALVEALTAKTLTLGKRSTQKRFDKRGRSWPDDPTSSPFTYKVKLSKAVMRISAPTRAFPRGGVKSSRRATNALAVVVEVRVHLEDANVIGEVTAGIRPLFVPLFPAGKEE